MVKQSKKIPQAQYDVIVIGAGPGGYVAAIRCAQLGLKTACVDEWLNHAGQSSLGGTCLNVGCIPSKALLESSLLFARAKQDFAQHGIDSTAVHLDLKKMQARKEKQVKKLTQGIAALFKANKVNSYKGRGVIKAADQSAQYRVEVMDRKTQRYVAQLSATNIIVATGSSPLRLPQAPLTDHYILDSAGALELQQVPGHLGIIGAGAIGLELGSIWQRLGAKVTLLEALPDLLPMVDNEISAQAKKIFTRQGLDIKLDARLVNTLIKNRKVQVNYATDGKQHQQVFDKLVVAVGRKPNSERVFGKEFGVETNERCYIRVNKNLETTVPGIYAIGDVIGGKMLAHKAAEEGIQVARRIAAQHAGTHHGTDSAGNNAMLIPSVIYTHPEIAWVGKTEQQCNDDALDYRIGRFPLRANGRAMAMGEPDGLIKIISDTETGQILGVHIMSAQASEIIAQAVIAMEMQATVEDLAMMVFAHPTLSESLHEAALALQGQAIHIMN